MIPSTKCGNAQQKHDNDPTNLTFNDVTNMKAILALEDGRPFPCRSFTGPGEVGGEVVFNTSMSGYQEVLTDPSYSGQLVTMTYPLIGNYGVNLEDVESDRVQVAAFLIREYQSAYSNYRATTSLADYLTQNHILGVDSLDTRALTRHIRETGALRAILSTSAEEPAALVQKAQRLPSMAGLDLAKTVTAGPSHVAGPTAFPRRSMYVLHRHRTNPTECRYLA